MIPLNTAPIAQAGPAQTVASGATPVAGSETDADAGQTLTYAWMAPAGRSAATFTAPTVAADTRIEP